MLLRTTIIAAFLAPLLAASAARGQCEEQWTAGFGVPGVDGEVLALAVFDDGTGPALYVGGRFTTAGDVAARHIARWNGTSWSALDDGLDGEVRALAVFDDGNGPAIYVGGNFTAAGDLTLNYVAKWDGFAWSPLDTGTDDEVNALAVYDADGDAPNAPALFAGGAFITAGGVTASRIARWDGTAWSVLGAELNDDVRALTVFDEDGSGPAAPALYAGGWFDGAYAYSGSANLKHIGRWNGLSWSAVDSGANGPVNTLAAFPDVATGGLLAGGQFSAMGTAAASNVAQWNGAIWSAIPGGTDGVVAAVAVYNDDGGGPAFYAGGQFTMAGGVPASCVAEWTGWTWQALGGGLRDERYQARANAMVVYDGGTGPTLYVAGQFTSAGGVAASCIAKWHNGVWTALGVGHGVSGDLHALGVFNSGGGPALYAGGRFTAAGNRLADAIARWDGSAWSPVGSGLGDSYLIPQVSALATFDDGTGPALYAGGHFTGAAGVDANHIARWDGTSWSTVGGGTDNDVYALCVFDDGTGSALYAGGLFRNAGGSPVSGIAKWDGTSWTPLNLGVNGRVYALAVYDDGTGPALYVGGDFTLAGGNSASYIARWQHGQWTPVGGGAGGLNYPAIYSLGVFDDGFGPELYVGGHFTTAGGVQAKYVAKWDGVVWSPVGSGFSGAAPESYAMAVLERETGPAMFVGGSFQRASGMLVNGTTMRQGGYWYPMDGGLDAGDALPYVYALAAFNDGAGPALYVGGQFTAAGGVPSVGLARWTCPLILGDLNCDGAVDNFDINPFVLALTDPGGYDALYPDCDRNLADANGDGVVDNFDINPFVDLLTGG